MDKERIEEQAREILNQLTLDEKLSMMDGDSPFWSGIGDMMSGGYNAHPWPAGVIPEKGIQGIQFVDGPRGIILKGATTFPVSMARGASWDIELEERIGEVIGKELRANGGNFFGGVCINLPRHPAWGRAQETYSEDPVILGEMGAALSRGVQKHGMACVKHFALNSMENSRFDVDVKISDRALHEVYLPHFKRVVDSGVASVMSAYNSMNGEWCGQNKVLLTEILKKKWGFQGFVITDFIFGMKDAKKAALAGQDVEMPFEMLYHKDLKQLVEKGEVPESAIDEAVMRILRMQLRILKPINYGMEVNGCKEHRQLALEAAEKSMVLLKNEGNLLPIRGKKKIAVIGRLANLPITGDGGSSNTQPEYVITPLQGIQAKFSESAEVIHDDASDHKSAIQIAGEADAVILIVGYTHDDEGEYIPPELFKQQSKFFPQPTTSADRAIYNNMFATGDDKDVSSFAVGGDRTNLNLRDDDIALIKEVAKANKNTIVSVIAGSTVLMEDWRNEVSAIIMQWYAGMEGGNALANILAGDVNPSGKLPFVVPTNSDHLPYFDLHASEITYDLWHGYRKLDRDGNKPAFPFGFGLSYTTFSYSSLKLNKDSYQSHETITVSLRVTNTGDLDGEEVVQLYISGLNSKVDRAPKELKAFARKLIRAGETREIIINLPISELAYFDESQGDFVIESITYEVFVGSHERDEHGLKAKFNVIN